MRATADHAAIETWALKNDAVPAEITPRKFDGEPAILHFLFGRAQDGSPEIVQITWESFFAQFDLLDLMMSFDDSPTFEILHKDRPSIGFAGSGTPKLQVSTCPAVAPPAARETVLVS